MSSFVCRVFCAAAALSTIAMPGCTAVTPPSAVDIVEPLDPALCQETPFDIPDITDVPRAKAGALAYAGGVLVFVPDDQGLPINARWTEDGRLLLAVDGQPDRTICVNVNWTYREDEKVLVNPLVQMSAEEVRGLWGVRLEAWSAEIAEKLQDLDTARACITLTEGAAVPPDRTLPPLPTGTRYLSVTVHASNLVFTDLSPLRTLRDLRYLAYHGLNREPMDARVLEHASQLEHLDVRGNPLQNLETLGHLTSLRKLDLGWCRELADIQFVQPLFELQAVRVSQTRVADLGPLTGLNKLEYVNADRSPVCWLPAQPLPALRVLRVLSTNLSEEKIAAFRQANPACAVMSRWGATLQGALAKATRLRIRSGGTCHRDRANEQTLFESKDRLVFEELIAAIDVNEAASGFECMCCGEPSLEFYAGDTLLLTLGFHHGKSLRWVAGWPGDASLTEASADFLVKWLASHQVLGPQEEIDSARNRDRTEEQITERAVQGMTPALQAAVRNAQSSSSLEEVTQALRSDYPDPLDQVGVLLMLFGVSNDSWSTTGWREQLAEALLDKYPQETLHAATERALRGEDRRRRRGAARFWQAWRSPLEGWQPANAVELYRIVLTVQQESRYYPTRQAALNNLNRWQEEFSEEEQTRWLQAGLGDPHPSVRRSAMITAGRIGHQPSVLHLRKVLAGESLPVVPLPDVPQDETLDISEGFDNACGQRPEEEVAALALAYLEDSESKDVILTKTTESPLYDVALALLGVTDRLKAEHFRWPEENTELQLAAVRAVLRCKGRTGLQWAINYQQAEYWWEEESVAASISRMLCEEKAPGCDSLVDCNDLKALASWYEAHGSEYLKRFEQ